MTSIKETYSYESEERRIKGCIRYRQFRLKAAGKFICIYLFISLFKQYLDRGAQLSEAGLNWALFNINLLTNNILQNTEFQITKVLT